MNTGAWAALREGFTEPVRDALWGHVYLTPALEALTKHAAFTRLNRILQLGPASLVYPGATHTRACHSLGVYHLARRLLLNLAEQGADEWISASGVKSFLCAGLLHDIGHFPYTHSLKELPLRSHEELSGEIILEEGMKKLVSAAGADPFFTAAVVDPQIPGGGDRELRFYRKLLSGPLDPDKLDYLTRDARYCGVPYGVQDVDFILSRLLPHQERGVDIDSRGVPGVESLLFSKYLMYRTVYWHRSVRSATAMIKKALLGGLREEIFPKDALYGLDDSLLFTLFPSEGPLFSLARRVREGQLYAAAAEFPFDAETHQPLLDIMNRYRREEDLAEQLSQALDLRIPPEGLIIDVPEPVFFETDIYVADESCYFEESPGILKPKEIEKSLRIIRIFIDPTYEHQVKSYKGLRDLLLKGVVYGY